MTDPEKLAALLEDFTRSILKHGDFDEMSYYVVLAVKMADILDERQRVCHRNDVNRRLMNAWGPTVCN
jgi:hypothetical protein